MEYVSVLIYPSSDPNTLPEKPSAIANSGATPASGGRAAFSASVSTANLKANGGMRWTNVERTVLRTDRAQDSRMRDVLGRRYGQMKLARRPQSISTESSELSSLPVSDPASSTGTAKESGGSNGVVSAGGAPGDDIAADENDCGQAGWCGPYDRALGAYQDGR